MQRSDALSRRAVLAGTAGLAAVCAMGRAARAVAPQILARKIPSTGEAIPLIGLGSWISFNVGDDPAGRKSSAAVMEAFFQAGGRMIDSSPMYGSAQEVIGEAVGKLGAADRLFSATKVWISGADEGREQIEESRLLWQLPRFDLLQIHNLVSWEEHLETLLAMKADGRLRYVGITTSHGRRHDDIEAIMQAHPIDFIQITYNAEDREVERRILPLAKEKRIGVIVNRPFQGGRLTDALDRAPLPVWAAEIDCANWAQILLKFVVSHPAVTCAIPATSKVAHVQENMGACVGRLPDEALRKRIVAHVAES